MIECKANYSSTTVDEVSAGPYHPGEVMIHKCIMGNEVADGDQKRKCLADGTFGGQKLVCQGMGISK